MVTPLKPLRKIRYIEITSEILQQEGIESVTIRKVAERAGCTSAVLYKHFENKEHLIMLASVRFLEPYIIEFIKLSSREDLSSIQIDLLLWKCFIDEAFRNKPYYELMFFSDHRDMLEDCVYEYYQMFPEVQRRFDGFSASIIFSNNLQERELLRLRRAAHAGVLSLEDAALLSRLTVAVFNGIFTQYSGITMTDSQIRSAAEECYQLIYTLFQRFLPAGVPLDTTP